MRSLVSNVLRSSVLEELEHELYGQQLKRDSENCQGLKKQSKGKGKGTGFMYPNNRSFCRRVHYVWRGNGTKSLSEFVQLYIK